MFDSWIGKIRCRGDRLPTPVFLGFLCGSAGKKSSCNAGDLGSIPGLRRSTGEGKGYPLPYTGLESSMDCIVHGVTKSRTQLSNFHFHSTLQKPSHLAFLFSQTNKQLDICSQRESYLPGRDETGMGDTPKPCRRKRNL